MSGIDCVTPAGLLIRMVGPKPRVSPWATYRLPLRGTVVMNAKWYLAAVIVLLLVWPCPTFAVTPVNKKLQTYIAEREAEFGAIPAERKKLLETLAGNIRERLAAGETVRLNFICTHNSRRSHLSQLWAWTAAAHYGVDKIETFSGGTEATAFNPRAVAALQRIGFEIEPTTGTPNPIYRVTCGDKVPPVDCFSKKYSDPPNPQRDYIAIMTCTHADENCPIVVGATKRISVPFDDPKAFDGTPEEAAKYSERCAQIAREMLYVFGRVRG